MKIRSFLVILVLVFFLVSCEDISQDYNPEKLDHELILKIVNQKRADTCYCGRTAYPPVGEVKWNDTLEYEAKNYSIRMNTQNFIDYSEIDALQIGNKLNDIGYNYSNFGVNILKGYTDEEKVVNFWFGHSHYCQRLMNGNFTEIGLARSSHYWTMVLTAR